MAMVIYTIIIPIIFTSSAPSILIGSQPAKLHRGRQVRVHVRACVGGCVCVCFCVCVFFPTSSSWNQHGNYDHRLQHRCHCSNCSHQHHHLHGQHKAALPSPAQSSRHHQHGMFCIERMINSGPTQPYLHPTIPTVPAIPSPQHPNSAPASPPTGSWASSLLEQDGKKQSCDGVRITHKDVEPDEAQRQMVLLCSILKD